MAWTKLQYSKKEINDAGAYLLNDIEPYFLLDSIKLSKREHAIDIIDNFRAAHAFPLNILQNTLRRHARGIDAQIVVAQRLKRFSSILAKLYRFETMELSQMQDIGGCRAIVRELSGVQELVDSFKSSRIRHKLSGEKDYIERPKDSGYRSRHLVYRYFSDKNDIYDGLSIEIQIRTTMQHAWATAVETIDAFTQQALKSSKGLRDWERFFQLMGTEMAFRENTRPVPKTPTDRKKLLIELKNCANYLQAMSRFSGFSLALRVSRDRFLANPAKRKYFLLSLDANIEDLYIRSYSQDALEQASKDYSDREKEIREKKQGDAVLVSVDSIQDLRRAYPNYFADTSMFIEILEDSIKNSA